MLLIKIGSENGAGVGAGCQKSVFPEPGRRCHRFARFPCGFASGKFLLGNIENDLSGGNVDFDHIAVFNQCNGSSGGGFGADVPDTGAACATAETSVRDQRDFLAEPASMI